MIKLVPQKRFNHCHIGVLTTVLNAYKRNVKYKQIKKEVKDNSLYSIRKYLEKYGIKCKSIEFDKTHLKNLEFNLMIVVCKNIFSRHFIVIEKENNEIRYYDPSLFKSHLIKKRIVNKMSGQGILLMSDDYAFNDNKFNIHYPSRVILLSILVNILVVLLIFNKNLL